MSDQALSPEVRDLLRELAERRPIFHSEADFQHAFAWLWHRRHPDATVRLEVPKLLDGRRIHVDIWLADDKERVAIELKYLTRGLRTAVGGEEFELRDQAAQDLGRYDILKDLVRVQTLVAAQAASRGLVIALTNDAAYWSAPAPRTISPIYSAFRLDGGALAGTLAWGPGAGLGTIRGREAALVLRRPYQPAWEDYARIPEAPARGLFRYLLFEVP